MEQRRSDPCIHILEERGGANPLVLSIYRKQARRQASRQSSNDCQTPVVRPLALDLPRSYPRPKSGERGEQERAGQTPVARPPALDPFRNYPRPKSGERKRTRASRPYTSRAAARSRSPSKLSQNEVRGTKEIESEQARHQPCARSLSISYEERSKASRRDSELVRIEDGPGTATSPPDEPEDESVGHGSVKPSTRPQQNLCIRNKTCHESQDSKPDTRLRDPVG